MFRTSRICTLYCYFSGVLMFMLSHFTCSVPFHSYTPTHKLHIYIEYHRVCPRVGIGDLPLPLPQASVLLPPEPKRGHTRLRVRGWGCPNSNDWRKSLALCLLCAPTQTHLGSPQLLSVYIHTAPSTDNFWVFQGRVYFDSVRGSSSMNNPNFCLLHIVLFYKLKASVNPFQ